MTEENKTIVFVGNKPVQNVFTDIVELTVNNETAQLKIGLRNQKDDTAEATHNIIMTLSHFMRLADAINSTKEAIKKIESTSEEKKIK